ncbi:MAG TPA: carboxypeptidase regulatory-like domain-containing protein, partial [Pirellulales bacterium]|nr:carboxypeptidase regulatory-like domain-containing protein [Pirellulales bacterium]
GRVHHTGGVAANGSYSETLTAPLPGVSPGTYYVVLRSDIRNQVPETDETNNLSVSAQTSLDVPEIIAGTPGSPVVGSLTQGGSAYYKVTVDAGQTLQFTLSDAQANDVNGLYVSFGQTPSPGQSDFHGDQALGANQAITIPSTQAGTYYVQVISRTVYGYNPQANPTAVANYSLSASIIPFSVTAVSPGQIGNAGSSTLKISGAKFDRDTTFQLLDGSGDVIQASSVYLQDGSTAFATYDLDGRAIGQYDVQATAGDGSVAKLASGLTLVAGSGANLATSANGPGIVLVNRLQAFTVTYANTGDADMPAPLFAVSSPTGVTMGLSPDYVGSPVVQFLAVSGSGPAGILRPGDSATVSVYFRSGTPNDPYGFVWNVITADDTTPLDWNVVLENYLSSADSASPDWNAIWSRVQARVGDTWGDLVRALARDASLLPSELGSNASPTDLLRLEISLAAADVEPSIRGTVVAADPTVTLGGRRISAEDTATGDTYYGVLLNDGSFALSGLPDGTYQLKVADVANDSVVQATISGGASADHLSVPVSRGFALTGAVFAADGFTPSASASISLIAFDGTVRSAFSASDGSFGVFGLSAGAYTLVVESAGFARQVSTITLTNADLAENFTLAPEATISGAISLAPGGADHGTLAVSAVGIGAFSAALHFNAEASAPGAFTIHDLPAGTYDLTLWMDGYFPQTIENVVVGAAQHVSLGPITFAPTASISGSLASNDAGLDLNQLVVGLYSGGAQVAATTTDAFGNYTFPNLSAGTYEVRPAGFAFASPATRFVTIAAGENATTPSIDVEAGATIAGAVTNSTSGGTLSGVIVYLDAADGSRKTTTTDVNGNYSFNGLPLGAYQVYVSRSAAGGLQTAQVSSVEGQAIIANLNVAVAAVINGTVSDSAGGVISGATVKLYQTGSATLAASTQTASDGSYQFLILAPGAFDIVVTDPTASFAPQTNISATTGTVTEDFAAGGSTLSITVSDPINPIAGAYVMLSFEGPAGSELLGTTTLDGTGVVTFNNLAAGNYSVAVLGTTGDSGSTTLSLSTNETDAISLEIGPLSAVSGTITDATSTPIPNALVELVPSSNAGNAIIIAGEADGSFSFDGVPDGTYTLIASAPGYLSSYTANVTVAGANVVQNATLTPTADTVAGRILDVAGAPVAHAPVALVDAAGNVLATATTQDDGSFTLTDAGTSGMHVEAFYGQNVYDQSYTFAHAAGAVTTPDFTLPATIAVAAGDVAANSAATGTGNAALLASPAGNFAAAQLNDFAAPQGPTNQAWLASLEDLQEKLAELFGGLLSKDQVPKPQPFTDNCNDVHQSQAWPLYQKVLDLIDRRDDAAKNANDIAGQVVTDALLTLGTFLAEGGKLAGTVAGLGLAVVALGPEGLAAGAFGFTEVQVSIGLLIGGVIKGLASAEAESEGEGFVDDLTKLPELATRIEQSVKILEIAAEKILGQEITLEEEIAIEENLIKFATGGKPLGGIPYQAYLDIANNKALLNTLKGLGQVVGLVTNSLEAAKAIVSDPFENTTEFAEITEQEYDRYKEALEQFDTASEKVEKAYEKYIEFLAKEREDANNAMSNSEWKHDPKPLVPPFNIPLPPPFDHWPIPFPQIPHFPFDPNDIVGPEGYGDQHFVPADQPLGYEIEFENESAATAPAQEVTITEQLDPNIDPRSFRLGDFGWGGMRFSPPPDSAFYQTTIDETDALGILVQVTATIDVSSGTAIWNFLSIDPATGEKPLDGGKGFLPPDDGAGSGQGFVTYTVLPDAGVRTGDVIHAQATIYFDSNAPIDTRTIFNTIDDGLSLGSQISGLPAHEPTPQFTLSWAPANQDPSASAVATYDVYVSDNGGPFTPFIINTTATQATFNGQKGHTYTFYSLATDNAGNQQSPASAVQVTTTVGDAVQNATGLTISPTEGQSFSGAVATFTGTDPNGLGDDFTAMIDWGDGSTLTAGTISGSAADGYTVSGSHIYLEEHAGLALKAIITDQGNQQTTVSGLANVADALLTAAGVTFTPTEGATFSGTVATFTDADPNGEVSDYTATIDWGDGSSLSAGAIAVNPAGGFLVTGSHAYADEGVHTVIVAISDAGGSNDTALSTAHVADAPIDAAAVTFHATEGATFGGTVATFTDANPNGVSGDYTATIDWGDGSSLSFGTISVNPGGGFLVTGSHVYAEYGTRAVTVTVSDVGGSAATAHSTAEIADAPLTAAGLTISSTEGATFSGDVATFTDANPAGAAPDYSATIYWGDGASSAGTIAAGAGGFTVSGSHV